MAWNSFQQSALRLTLALFLVDFDFVPGALHVVGSLGVAFRKNVRMPADQLLRDSIQRIVDAKLVFLCRHLRNENSLQHEVAEFVGEPRPIAIVDGLQHLISFFEEIRLDGVKALLAIPRAAIGRTQPRHDTDQALESFPSCNWIGGHCRALEFSLWHRGSGLCAWLDQNTEWIGRWRRGVHFLDWVRFAILLCRVPFGFRSSARFACLVKYRIVLASW